MEIIIALVQQREKLILANHFNEIYHVAPLYDELPSSTSMKYASKNIKFIPLKPSGGKGLLNKLNIVFKMPYNLIQIHRTCKKVDWVQFRAPTNLGLYVLPYLSFRKSKTLG